MYLCVLMFFFVFFVLLPMQLNWFHSVPVCTCVECVSVYVCEYWFCMRACVVNSCMCIHKRQLNLLNSIEFKVILFLFSFSFCSRAQDTLKSMQTFKYGINSNFIFFIYSTDLHMRNSRSLFSSNIFPWADFFVNIHFSTGRQSRS